jgi:hypothetical protein
MHCLSSRCPLVLLSCHPLVLSSSSHCAALSLSHLTSWCHLSSHRPLIVLSLRRSCCLALSDCCIASHCAALSSCRPLVVPPSRPLLVLSLRRPLVVSSQRLVVALPLVAPPSCRPLTPLLLRPLAPAGCCVDSHRAALLSSRRAALSSSHCPLP